MAVEDLQIWADHLETIRLPEIEADIADIQPRLSQAEADIVSKVQTINDTLTLHSARIDEAQVDANAAMDRANYALTRVYDQFIEANSNWMLALDALRDEFTYDLNSSTASITDAYTNAILAQLSAATLQLQTQFDVKVAEVDAIKATIDGIKSDIDLDIDTLNNDILPGMNAEIDQLKLDTATITGDLTTLQTELQTFYYSATDTELAIAGAITTAKSEIEDPNGTSLGATLAQSYRTSADQDTVTAAQLLTLQSDIEDPNGSSLGATLNQNYYTSASTDSAIAAEISTVQASINGVSANVTAVSNALADVEDNLAASYTLRVSAGGASAGLEIVAADNVGGSASSLRISADSLLLEGAVNIIDTLQIKGNAVVVPVSQTLLNSIPGDDTTIYQLVQELSITLNYPGYVTVLFNAQLGYLGQWQVNGEPHKFDLQINDVSKVTRGGVLANDYPNIAWTEFLAAGTHTAKIYWYGTSETTLSKRTLIMLGTMR